MATAMKPQILLMDEWFLAGDASFIEKARNRLESLVFESEILVLSTHNEKIVLDWATRAIWLDQGRVCADGAPSDVMQAYMNSDHNPVYTSADEL